MHCLAALPLLLLYNPRTGYNHFYPKYARRIAAKIKRPENTPNTHPIQLVPD